MIFLFKILVFYLFCDCDGMGWARRVVYGILWRVWGAVAIHTYIHTYIRNSWVWRWYIYRLRLKEGESERGPLLRLRVLFRDVSNEITNYLNPRSLLCSSPHIDHGREFKIPYDVKSVRGYLSHPFQRLQAG